MFESIRQTVGEWYAGRNEREQRLIQIAGVVLPLVGLAFVTILHNQSLETVRSDIETYEETLDLLGDIAPTYRKQKKSEQNNKSDDFSREALETNDIKLTSFVATHATAVGIQVDSYNESERRIGGGDDEDEGSPLHKLSVDVEIRQAPIDKVLKLLERIEKASEPVVIERFSLTKKKGDTGKVRVDIVVTTFERTAEG